MPSLAALVDAVAVRLCAAGIDEARREARLIVTAATGLDRTRQLAEPNREVEAEPTLALAARRVAREPMAYLTGSREFWGLDFRVGPGVLVPRPETETLIEAVLEAFPAQNAPLRIADLGTGSGCLLLTLLTLYPAATGIGIDYSTEALRWAARNRRRLGLEHRALLVRASWMEAVQGPFDLVVANPPYIAIADARDLETAHEPRAALLAGADGLDAYRAIAGPAFATLRRCGLIVLEIGAAQAAAVSTMLEAAGFSSIECRNDLAGRPRALVARRPGATRR